MLLPSFPSHACAPSQAAVISPLPTTALPMSLLFWLPGYYTLQTPVSSQAPYSMLMAQPRLLSINGPCRAVPLNSLPRFLAPCSCPIPVHAQAPFQAPVTPRLLCPPWLLYPPMYYSACPIIFPLHLFQSLYKDYMGRFIIYGFWGAGNNRGASSKTYHSKCDFYIFNKFQKTTHFLLLFLLLFLLILRDKTVSVKRSYRLFHLITYRGVKQHFVFAMTGCWGNKNPALGVGVWIPLPCTAMFREGSLFMGWGGHTTRKSLYLSRMTLFKQTILYVSLYFP